MITIGSTAIKHWYSDFNRIPKDIDYIVKCGLQYNKEPGIEYLENPIIYNLAKGERFLNPCMLTTLKASHLMWDLSWEKHMWDLQFLLKKGNRINPYLFFKLYDYWNTVHVKNKRSDLKMSKEDFFTNAINYDEHEHDELHKLINPTPVYTLVLKEGKEVELCETRYNNLSHEQKMSFVSEEVMVMSYERYKHLNYRAAYARMLKKFIISHAPTFSLIFILENYIELSKPKFNHLEKISHELQTIK